ncbi:uncharacterized protein N7500_008160 [Penicillium coprophilum]|uniref:uncharacterized protein n=1 Tax=Penicillium coprophilum TaxID=36646 RepID=UPI00239E2C21|nr:uncharacterized protein N7500_008160 [Penicillium coprophilum]KAJ5158509.1 hypothetical protein N7500_008160 [Penicillium coprophilum]
MISKPVGICTPAKTANRQDGSGPIIRDRPTMQIRGQTLIPQISSPAIDAIILLPTLPPAFSNIDRPSR